MATLADSFLLDLEDLEADQETEETAVLEEADEEIVDALEAYLKSREASAAVASSLTQDDDFLDIIEQVRAITSKEKLDEEDGEAEEGIAEKEKEASSPVEGGEIEREKEKEEFEGPSEEEYELIEKCNGLVVRIDTEILNVHKFIRDIYSKKFPELDSIVLEPLAYVAVVQRVQNETDLTKVDLTDILPNQVIMSVQVTASMTAGTPLPSAELDKVLKAVVEAQELADFRLEVLTYLESRMTVLAPNLASILGSALAARLITKAGGLNALSRMPAQNIMLIGSSKKSSMGMAQTSATLTQGLIMQSDIIQGTPAEFRNRAIKLVTGKCGLAARVDEFRQSTDGAEGKKLREQIFRSLGKNMEPPPAPLKKALPAPPLRKLNRRGGKRHRRMKEKYGMSEFRKQANRLKFGMDAEEEYGGTGEGFGMIGQGTGTSRLRVETKKNKVQRPITKKSRQLAAKAAAAAASGVDAGVLTGGTQSSLVMTPVQGMHLVDPAAAAALAAERQRSTAGYFNTMAGFTRVERDRGKGKG